MNSIKDAFEEALKKRSMGAPALTITIGGPAPEMEMEEEMPEKEEKKKEDSRELGLAPDIELQSEDASDDGEDEEAVDENMEMAQALQGPESDEQVMESMDGRKPRSLGEHLKLKMAQIKK